MAHDAREIANWFVKRAARDGRTLSIMHLLKLIYVAHGWFLETRDKPLISNKIEAWQYGPVIPDVYHAFRSKGIDVRAVHPEFSVPSDSDTSEFLEEIYGIYGNMPAFHLSDITHVANGPWERASREGGYYAEIPDSLIAEHYRAKRENSQKANS